MIYRVTFFDPDDNEHQGYEYFKSKLEAIDRIELAKKENQRARIDDWAPAPKTRADLVDMLDDWAGHPFPGSESERRER